MKKKICSKCKGENVESLYWVNPNTKEVGEPRRYGTNDTDESRHYCTDCMEFVTLEDENKSMKHKLSGDAETRKVYLNGKFLDPGPSQKHHNHSPDGFNWGYGGSGPAQLALAIMLKLTGKTDGYQDFKFRVIGAIPDGKDFEIEFNL